MIDCAATSCDRPALSNVVGNLCQAHYMRRRARRSKGLPDIPLDAMTPVVPRPVMAKSTLRDSEGRKRCSVCAGFFPEDQFYKGKSTVDGLCSACIPCTKTQSIKSQYGLPKEAVEAMLLAQGNACSICRTPFGTEFATTPHVDHDHRCCPGNKACGDCVRGLLCHHCNVGLGKFYDNPALLMQAVAYLAQNPASSQE